MTQRSVTVARREALTPHVVALTLVPDDGAALPGFEAGSHVDVLTPSGAVRQYSLCNVPGETAAYRIAVLDEPQSRGGSRSLCRDVREGDRLQIGAPRNLFALAPRMTRAILLAGGIGITPIVAMAHALHRAGTPFELHHASRSRAACAFARELEQAPFARQVHLSFDDEGPALDLERLLAAPGPNDHLYVCGPAGYIQWVLETAARHAWPVPNVHREFFAPANDATALPDQAFEIELASSGAVLQVPAGQSMASVLLAHGVVLPMSCEQGVCGTCVTTVLAGEPEHRDSYLTEEDRARGDTVLPCCSRARSPRLVLDL